MDRRLHIACTRRRQPEDKACSVSSSWSKTRLRKALPGEVAPGPWQARHTTNSFADASLLYRGKKTVSDAPVAELIYCIIEGALGDHALPTSPPYM